MANKLKTPLIKTHVFVTEEMGFGRGPDVVDSKKDQTLKWKDERQTTSCLGGNREENSKSRHRVDKHFLNSSCLHSKALFYMRGNLDRLPFVRFRQFFAYSYHIVVDASQSHCLKPAQRQHLDRMRRIEARSNFKKQRENKTPKRDLMLIPHSWICLQGGTSVSFPPGSQNARLARIRTSVVGHSSMPSGFSRQLIAWVPTVTWWASPR